MDDDVVVYIIFEFFDFFYVMFQVKAIKDKYNAVDNDEKFAVLFDIESRLSRSANKQQSEMLVTGTGNTPGKPKATPRRKRITSPKKQARDSDGEDDDMPSPVKSPKRRGKRDEDVIRAADVSDDDDDDMRIENDSPLKTPSPSRKRPVPRSSAVKALNRLMNDDDEE